MTVLSLDALSASNQLPRLSQLPSKAVGTAGDDAIAWAESLGFDPVTSRGFYQLDEWQKFCIRGMLSEDASARLCASVSLLLVPRQNGKNVILEVVELFALFVLELPFILHSAHLAETSAEHMARLWDAIQADDDLATRADRVVANGKEAIFRTDGVAGRIRFRTRSKKVGRGGSPQMVVFDEALYLADQQIQALLPSLSAQSTRDDQPLIIYTSSAPVAESVVLHRVRNAMHTGKMPDAFFAEWSAELPDGDPAQAVRLLVADRAAWVAANPGMPHRISPEWVAANELPMLTARDFAIERLGVVFEADGLDGVLPSSSWQACRDMESHITSGRVGLSVSPNSASAAFSFAGLRADGATHVEVVRFASGTDWVVEAALAAAKYGPLIVDPKTATAAVLPDLRRAGVELVEVTTPTLVEACAWFEGAVRSCSLRHLGQPELNAAVAGADIRPVGESWVFSAKASTVDVAPLLSVVLAASAAVGAEAPKPVGVPRRIR